MIALIFDTETTGLTKHPRSKDAVQPRIIEWGGVLVDEHGVVLDELDVLINPGQPLEPIITKITGLTDDDLANQPKFRDRVDLLRPFFERADAVIAHNLPFDSRLMELELARIGVTDWPWPQRKICTVQEHAEQWGRRPKLLELYQHYFDEPLEQKHRALDDVLALARIVNRCGVLSI
jgi:DNA polymerase III epsilon subunit-like protein